jgi:hypothetical protein
MALLTNQLVRRSGLNPSYAAAAGGGDTFAVPDVDTFLHVKVGATATTVTIPIPASRVPRTDLAYSALVVGPLTSAERMIGPIDPDLFVDPTTGVASVTYSQVTGVTIGVFTVTN